MAKITVSAAIKALLSAANEAAARVALGLGNVQNTSDANKPVSTATQTALDLKAPLASPALTGVPTAPTAAAGTSTTQIATTAFVATALGNLIGSAPAALDTLNELAAALNDDANFAATVTASLSGKLDATEFALAALIEGDPDLIRNACRAVQDPSDDGAGFISVGSQGVKLRGVDSTARLAAGDRFVSFFWDADGPVAESQFWSFENGSEFCPTFLFNGTANRGIWVPDKPGTLATLDDCEITGEVLISATTVLDASHMGKRLRNISGSAQTIVFPSVSGAVAGKTFVFDARGNGYVFAGNAPVAQGGVVSSLPAGSGLYQVRAVDGVWMVFGPTPTHTMMLTGDQTAGGQKTFSTSPISTGTPTQGTHILNRDQSDVRYGEQIYLVKPTNTDRVNVSATSRPADPHLTSGSLPAGTYHIQGDLYFTASANAPGYYMAVEQSNGTVLPFSAVNLSRNNHSNGTTQINRLRGTIAGDTFPPINAGAADWVGTSGHTVGVRGIVRLDTSGTISIRWGQNTPTADTTSLLAGSYLIIRRVA
ncbi:MAG: hypothetical protein MUF31_16715 [Akkermansiaceae bacterium]|jgi:hypothetical protein|nr:hypothetical protein [Akkermansiaceae bacterium]